MTARVNRPQSEPPLPPSPANNRQPPALFTANEAGRDGSSWALLQGSSHPGAGDGVTRRSIDILFLFLFAAPPLFIIFHLHQHISIGQPQIQTQFLCSQDSIDPRKRTTYSATGCASNRPPQPCPSSQTHQRPGLAEPTLRTRPQHVAESPLPVDPADVPTVSLKTGKSKLMTQAMSVFTATSTRTRLAWLPIRLPGLSDQVTAPLPRSGPVSTLWPSVWV